MLRIRSSTPLFRLPSAGDVLRRLRFLPPGCVDPEAAPAVIGMWIEDPRGEIDPKHDRVVVLWNASDETQIVTVRELEGAPLTLHPILRRSADPVARAASVHKSLGAFSIPGRTTAVFWSERP
jgi:hypothetical protein